MLLRIYSSSNSSTGHFETKEWLERVVIVGYSKKPSVVNINSRKSYFRYMYVLTHS